MRISLYTSESIRIAVFRFKYYAGLRASQAALTRNTEFAVKTRTDPGDYLHIKHGESSLYYGAYGAMVAPEYIRIYLAGLYTLF